MNHGCAQNHIPHRKFYIWNTAIFRKEKILQLTETMNQYL